MKTTKNYIPNPILELATSSGSTGQNLNVSPCGTSQNLNISSYNTSLKPDAGFNSCSGAISNDYLGSISSNDCLAAYQNMLEECGKILGKAVASLSCEELNEDLDGKLSNLSAGMGLACEELNEDLDEMPSNLESNRNNPYLYRKPIEINGNDKDNPTFLHITYNNGICKQIYLTNEEVLVLKLAVLHSYNRINLMNRIESVKSLINKGLLHFSENGGFVVVNKLLEIIIKTDKKDGQIVVDNSLQNELKKDDNSNPTEADVERVVWGRV